MITMSRCIPSTCKNDTSRERETFPTLRSKLFSVKWSWEKHFIYFLLVVVRQGKVKTLNEETDAVNHVLCCKNHPRSETKMVWCAPWCTKRISTHEKPQQKEAAVTAVCCGRIYYVCLQRARSKIIIIIVIGSIIQHVKNTCTYIMCYVNLNNPSHFQ